MQRKTNKKAGEHLGTVIGLMEKGIGYCAQDMKKLLFMETMLANVWCMEDKRENQCAQSGAGRRNSRNIPTIQIKVHLHKKYDIIAAKEKQATVKQHLFFLRHS